MQCLPCRVLHAQLPCCHATPFLLPPSGLVNTVMSVADFTPIKVMARLALSKGPSDWLSRLLCCCLAVKRCGAHRMLLLLLLLFRGHGQHMQLLGLLLRLRRRLLLCAAGALQNLDDVAKGWPVQQSTGAGCTS